MAWEDRLAHKNWKVRNDASIDIAAVCDGIMDPKDPRLREFGNVLFSLGSPVLLCCWMRFLQCFLFTSFGPVFEIVVKLMFLIGRC